MTDKILQEFREKFEEFAIINDIYRRDPLPGKLFAFVESFLTDALAQVRREVIEDMGRLYKNFLLKAHDVDHSSSCIECKEIAAYNAGVSDFYEALEALKPPTDSAGEGEVL